MLTILNTHIESIERPHGDGNATSELSKTIIKRNIRTPDGMFPTPDIYNKARGIYYRARRWDRKRPVTIL